MKMCSKCMIAKDTHMFVKSSRRKDGLNPHCKSCTKAWRDANSEVLLAKKRAYYQANIAIMPERNRRKYLKHQDKQRADQVVYYSIPENWAKRMVMKARLRAQQVGLDFDITVADFTIPSHCPYLGTELTFSLGAGQLPTNASLDRMDSSKGYIKGNMQVVSRKANTMKSNATNDELLSFANSILKHHAHTSTASP